MSDNDSHDEGSSMRKSQRKITKKHVFELKDEPTIKRTKKFKTNPDGSPIVPGYPQTYHAVLADAVASGGLPLGVVAAPAAADGSAPAAAAARAASLVQQTSSKTSKRSNKLYCLCQKPYEQDQPMIRCDECHEWYHFACLGVTDDASIAALEALDPYRCARCVSGVTSSTQKKPRKPVGSVVGKKRKSKRNDDDDAASEEENDNDGRRIDLADPTWVNPYADLLSDPVRCQQYSQSQLDQMRQFMNYNRAEYTVLQQQIAAQQQQAAQMAQAQAQAQAQATTAATATSAAPAAGTEAAAPAAAPAAAAAAAPENKA